MKEEPEANITLNKEEIDYLLYHLRLDINEAYYHLRSGNVAKSYESVVYKEISTCEKLIEKINGAI